MCENLWPNLWELDCDYPEYQWDTSRVWKRKKRRSGRWKLLREWPVRSVRNSLVQKWTLALKSKLSLSWLEQSDSKLSTYSSMTIMLPSNASQTEHLEIHGRCRGTWLDLCQHHLEVQKSRHSWPSKYWRKNSSSSWKINDRMAKNSGMVW